MSVDEKTIRVDRKEAELMRVVDGWALWRTSKPVDNNGSRLITAEFHFYRQRIPDPNAHLVLHTIAGAGFNPFQAITEDGTLIALTSESIMWYRLDGSIDKSTRVGKNESLLRAYPDGALLQVTRGRVITHVFVPFMGKDIDFEKRIQIRSWDDRLWRAQPVRHGNMMVWNTPEGLWTLDLKNGKRSSVVIKNDPPQFDLRKANATAFDGKLALLGSNAVVDAMSGERVATNWDDERINRIVMTHGRTGYRLWDGNLASMDLDDPQKKPVLIAKGVQEPMAETKEGILAWHSNRWNKILWHTPEKGDNPDRSKR
jgi:hypothetical protein